MKEVQILIKDDKTGKVIEPESFAAAELTTLTFNGKTYHWDFAVDTAEEFFQTLEPWLTIASKVDSVSRSKRIKTTQSTVVAEKSTKSTRKLSPYSAEERANIRRWAKDNGHEVHVRGNIPHKVVRAYEEAHRR